MSDAEVFGIVAGAFLSLAAIGGIMEFFRKLANRREARANKIRADEKRNRDSDTRRKNVLSGLTQSDASFSADDFVTRGRLIIEAVHKCITTGNFLPGRLFLSQGLSTRLRIHGEIMRKMQGQRLLSSVAEIREFRIDEYRRSGPYDVIDTKVVAKINQSYIPAIATASEAEELAAQNQPKELRFTCTFMRKQNSRGLSVKAANACSRCGSLLDSSGSSNKCNRCGTLMGTGEFDWVLTEISEEGSMQAPSRRDFKETISADCIEDRAGCLFWKYLQAANERDINLMSRESTPAFLAAPGPLESSCQIAVTGVTTLAVETAGDPVVANLRIQWSASALANSEVWRRDTRLRLQIPRSGLHAGSLATAGCRACGAPIPDAKARNCSRCGNPLPEHDADWLLDSIETSVV